VERDAACISRLDAGVGLSAQKGRGRVFKAGARATAQFDLPHEARETVRAEIASDAGMRRVRIGGDPVATELVGRAGLAVRIDESRAAIAQAVLLEAEVLEPGADSQKTDGRVRRTRDSIPGRTATKAPEEVRARVPPGVDA